MASEWYWYGVGMILVWYRHGSGMALVWYWNSVGILMVFVRRRYGNGIGMLLV